MAVQRWIFPSAMAVLAFGCVQIIGVEPGTLRGTGGSGGRSSGTAGGLSSSGDMGGMGGGATSCNPATCASASDCTAFSPPCATPSCSPAGCCAYSFAGAGMACSSSVSDGTVCDGMGSCVECITDTDCKAPPMDCVIVSCESNLCTPMDEDDGTLCDGGTCLSGQCEL